MCETSPRIVISVALLSSFLSLNTGNISLRTKMYMQGTTKPIINPKNRWIYSFGDIGPTPIGESMRWAVGVASAFCNAISSLLWRRKVYILTFTCCSRKISCIPLSIVGTLASCPALVAFLADVERRRVTRLFLADLIACTIRDFSLEISSFILMMSGLSFVLVSSDLCSCDTFLL